jgi:internalin A
MSTNAKPASGAAEPRALFSADGQTWSHNEGGGPVVKIVIGTPPKAGEEAKPVQLSTDVMRALATHLPSVTHLHLWQVTGLKKLDALPARLKCLDLRGCAELEALPELPAELETLDLGGCTGLKKLPSAPLKLERLFFDGCTGLRDLGIRTFLESLADAPLVEVDGSRSPLTTLDEMPRTALRKLVLAGCEKLASVEGIESFPALEHVNLSGCTALEVLPNLPPRLRFLVLHGAEKLETFMGQSIGPYDRGAEKQNVAAAFHTRRKFGHELAVMPHAKVLLMGDGRVGKSTLAKRLQYEETHAEEVKPDKDEPFTHKVRFWRWETGLSLPEKDATALEERAAAANLTLPKTKDGLLDGAVRLWDFGGQEIYHSTHRIFAGEGSIFLVVWRAEQPEIGANPDGVTPEEWREWNRQRSLDYWLDYIFSMRPEASVALVCTNCKSPDTMKAKPDWKARAPKHAQRELPAFWVDSLDEDCGRHAEYQRLVKWIREASGREAKRIGILQPKFFRQVSDLLDVWLEQNSRARHDEATPEHLLLPWARWEAEVGKAHGQNTVSLETADVMVITNYLHDAGHLFQIRHAAHRAVLVDQEWAADLIYQLLLCSGTLRRKVKRNGGWFFRADIEADPLWKALDDDIQRGRLLAYMEECRVVTRLADAERQRLGQDIFLASDKWLLPPYEDVERQVDMLKELVKERGAGEWEKFEFEELEISEFDFRALQSLLARTFGTRAIYFRDGLQALDEERRWCFRVRWTAKEEDAFAGKVDAVLLAPRAELDRFAEQIEDLFFSDDSPIRHLRRAVKRLPAGEHDLRHEFFRGIRPEEYDVAVSSSGADRAEALAMVAALKAAGIKVTHYLLPECRQDDRAGVLNFMNSLSRPPCVVLLLSTGYLRNDPVSNWYCAWELAAQTLAVYRDADSKALNEVVVPLLKAMGRHFGEAYAHVPWEDRPNFDYYDTFSKHFLEAVTGDKCRKFFEARGTLGSYVSLPADVNAAGAFDAIIAAVRAALTAKQTQ